MGSGSPTGPSVPTAQEAAAAIAAKKDIKRVMQTLGAGVLVAGGFFWGKHHESSPHMNDSQLLEEYNIISEQLKEKDAKIADQKIVLDRLAGEKGLTTNDAERLIMSLQEGKCLEQQKTIDMLQSFAEHGSKAFWSEDIAKAVELLRKVCKTPEEAERYLSLIIDEEQEKKLWGKESNTGYDLGRLEERKKFGGTVVAKTQKFVDREVNEK